MSKGPRFRITLPAQGDIENIIDWVADHFGERVADDVAGRLYASFELLGEQPSIGRGREEFGMGPDVLCWVIPSTPSLVFYRGSEPVEILRVWDSRQDPETLRI